MASLSASVPIGRGPDGNEKDLRDASTPKMDIDIRRATNAKSVPHRNACQQPHKRMKAEELASIVLIKT